MKQTNIRRLPFKSNCTDLTQTNTRVPLFTYRLRKCSISITQIYSILLYEIVYRHTLGGGYIHRRRTHDDLSCARLYYNFLAQNNQALAFDNTRFLYDHLPLFRYFVSRCSFCFTRFLVCFFLFLFTLTMSKIKLSVWNTSDVTVMGVSCILSHQNAGEHIPKSYEMPISICSIEHDYRPFFSKLLRTS